MVNPALDLFVASIAEGKVWGQVVIESSANRFLVRHVADRAAAVEALRIITVGEARKLAMFNEAGTFRPLHSSPDLPQGWVMRCDGVAELWRALQDLYPGSVPDWFAARTGEPPVTSYRDFTNRQTGMYRITQLLSDEQAANVTRAACHARFCLKRRLWSVNGLAVDDADAKSEIPCLEPCAILLELARKATRIEQEEKLDVQLSRSELESFLAATEAALEGAGTGERVGNVGAALNPRRLQLLIEKFKKFVETTKGTGEPEE